MLSRASLLALAKSIYYFRVARFINLSAFAAPDRTWVSGVGVSVREVLWGADSNCVEVPLCY